MRSLGYALCLWLLVMAICAGDTPSLNVTAPASQLDVMVSVDLTTRY